MLITAPLVALAMFLTILSGIVVFANYAGCDPISLGLVQSKDQILPFFVLENLSATPGLAGLFTACLLSGALSTISSGLNSLAAVLWEDVLKDIPYFADLSENKQGGVVKIIGFTYGILTVGMAFIAGSFSGILAAALVIFGAASGPILGIFILGIFLPFVNKYGAIVGMVSGELLIAAISVGGLLWAPKPTPLPYRIDECPESIWENLNQGEIMSRINSTYIPPTTHPSMNEWPYKIFTISYLLYTLVGAVSTVVVGIIVSLVTGPSKLTEENKEFVHPAFAYFRKLLSKNSKNSAYSHGRHNNSDPIKSYDLHDLTKNGFSIPRVSKNSKYHPPPSASTGSETKLNHSSSTNSSNCSNSDNSTTTPNGNNNSKIKYRSETKYYPNISSNNGTYC